MRRQFMLIVIITAAIFISSSCSSRKETKEITLRWSSWGQPQYLALWENLAREYEKEHPGVKVKVEHYPYTQYIPKLQAMMSAGIAPDVMWMEYKDIPVFAKRNALLELGPYIRDDKGLNISDFYEKQLSACSSGGIQYGLPSDFQVLALFYNKDMFKSGGVDFPDENWTWIEFLDAAKKLTRDNDNDGRTDQFGSTVILPHFSFFMPFVWQNGGELFNDTLTECLLNSLESREAIQFLADLIHKDKVIPSSSEASNYGPTQMFMTGKVAMVFNWSAVEISFQAIKNFQWDIASLPQGRKKATIYEGQGYVVSKDTGHPGEAWELIKFLTSENGQRIATEAGNIIPTRKSVVNSDIFLKPKGLSINNQACVDMLEYARAVSTVPHWGEIEDTMRRELELVILGKKPVNEACEILVHEVNNLLER